MKNVCYSLPIIALLFSCAKEESQNVNQDTIYTIYDLSYDKQTDITTAQATFRFGGPTGTLLKLNSPASVLFNSDQLLYNSFLGVHKREYAHFIDTGIYLYTDLNNNSYLNAIPKIDTISFPLVDTISMSGAYTFSWAGNPVGQNETVSITATGTTSGSYEVFSTIIQGNARLVLDASKLQKLGIGNATFTLSRSYDKFAVDQGTPKGGRVATSYKLTRSIYIKN